MQMILDGNRANFLHGDAALPTGFAYDIKLGAAVNMESIDIYPRNDCCPDRLSNIRVSVFNDDHGAVGAQVWSADLFTDPGANAGANPVHITANMDTNGTFKGQWIRIMALADPVPSYALQMAEVEVYGTLQVTTPTLSVTQQPKPLVGAPGRTARMTVTASVFNGDPALISYRWKKDGVFIPGATTGTNVTGLLQPSDNGAKYKAVISYPGLPDVESNETMLTFDYNYARGGVASNTGKLWVGVPSWTPQQLVDGDRTDFVHGDTAIAPGYSYSINMGDEVTLTNIDIYARQDACCPDRLQNFRVSVHKDNHGVIGDQVWSADLFTDGSNVGSGPGVFTTVTPDLDPTGTFKGQWIRIMSLADPVPDYALQIGEVEAIGSIQLKPVLTFSRANASAAGPITLTWTAGTIESASSVAGPWTAITPAPTSPYTPPRNGALQFYRAKQ